MFNRQNFEFGSWLRAGDCPLLSPLSLAYYPNYPRLENESTLAGRALQCSTAVKCGKTTRSSFSKGIRWTHAPAPPLPITPRFIPLILRPRRRPTSDPKLWMIDPPPSNNKPGPRHKSNTLCPRQRKYNGPTPTTTCPLTENNTPCPRQKKYNGPTPTTTCPLTENNTSNLNLPRRLPRVGASIGSNCFGNTIKMPAVRWTIRNFEPPPGKQRNSPWGT